MSMSFYHGSSCSRKRSGKSRRPQNVSRRQRKKQLGFETLEDRRVMSVQSPFADLELVTYSSATPEGQLQILLRELERYAQHSTAADASYETSSIPTDPLVPNQWHLINSSQQVGNPDFQNIFGTPGEDINVAPAWQLGYTGEGVVVAVVDSGTERLHPDLFANIHPTLQLDPLDLDGNANPEVFEFDPDNQFPWLASFDNAHGTAVAGIIAGVADNGIGGTGIAHGAQIVPIRLIDDGQTEQAFIDTFRYEIDEIDITNNSWEPTVIRGLDGPTANQLLAVRDSIFFGRPDENGNPLGVIHVFAAGNDGGAGSADSTSYNGWVNSRYTIGVTGIDHDGEYNNVDGTVTGYPETGPSVLIAAPTGSVFLDVLDDTGVGSGIVSTDTTGNTGFNVDPDTVTNQQIDRDFLDDSDYTSRFNGTSASAPMVSAAIALMLEANPNLTWRDVQEILVRSARQTPVTDTQADGFDKLRGVEYQSTWIVNQVPLFHDPDVFDPLIENTLQIVNPTLNPDLNLPDLSAHYAPTPQVLTNGAGYTVSQGRGTNFEQTGFAHGVLDVELAVLLAEQWHTKNQQLPDELTVTTAVGNQRSFALPAAEVVDNVNAGLGGNSDLVIPGGLGGAPTFSDYWAEYLV
ncbi:MAG: S8 family serine peptidase, partial [Pirellulales bacterium]|nr:S8 family serine peptidase [Pirellulales bacterium]